MNLVSTALGICFYKLIKIFMLEKPQSLQFLLWNNHIHFDYLKTYSSIDSTDIRSFL